MTPPGPMAKHPSTRQRRNAAASTSREITLRSPDAELLPVPELPVRRVPQRDENGKLVKGPDGNTLTVETDWHEEAVTTWTELWQWPLWYQAPASDRHAQRMYVQALDQMYRNMEAGKPFTELLNQIRIMGEQWGIGEKARRHLQITIQEAEEAIERGRKAATRRVESGAAPVEGTQQSYLPKWSEDDEDDGSIIDAEVVE